MIEAVGAEQAEGVEGTEGWAGQRREVWERGFEENSGQGLNFEPESAIFNNKGATVEEASAMPEFRPLSKPEIRGLQNQSDDLYNNRLTKGDDWTERWALDGYTTGKDQPINTLLYGKSDDPPSIQELYKKEIALIDSAMGKWKQEESITVFSGTNAEHY